MVQDDLDELFVQTNAGIIQFALQRRERERMNIDVSVTKEDILIVVAAAAAVTVVKVVIVVVFWKHSLDDLVVLIGHVPSRSEWQLPSRRSDNRKIA